MQCLCEYMKIDCEIDCDARGLWLRSCRGHQITQGQHWAEPAASGGINRAQSMLFKLLGLKSIFIFYPSS